MHNYIWKRVPVPVVDKNTAVSVTTFFPQASADNAEIEFSEQLQKRARNIQFHLNCKTRNVTNMIVSYLRPMMSAATLGVLRNTVN